MDDKKPRPTRAHDYETTSEEAAARFEHDRADEPVVRIMGHPFDPDEIPSGDEL